MGHEAANQDAEPRQAGSGGPLIHARILPDVRVQPVAPVLHDQQAARQEHGVELSRPQPAIYPSDAGPLSGCGLPGARARQDVPREWRRLERGSVLEHRRAVLLSVQRQHLPDWRGGRPTASRRTTRSTTIALPRRWTTSARRRRGETSRVLHDGGFPRPRRRAARRMYDLYDELLAGPTHPLSTCRSRSSRGRTVSVQSNGTHFPFAAARGARLVQRTSGTPTTPPSCVDEHIGALLAGWIARGSRGGHRGDARRPRVPGRARHREEEQLIGGEGAAARQGAGQAALVRQDGGPAGFVDVFPTLAALAGLPPPAGVDGTDVRPSLISRTPS